MYLMIFQYNIIILIKIIYYVIYKTTHYVNYKQSHKFFSLYMNCVRDLWKNCKLFQVINKLGNLKFGPKSLLMC